MSPALSDKQSRGAMYPFTFKLHEIEARQAPTWDVPPTTTSTPSPNPSPSQPDENDSSDRGGLTKAVLEYLFLGVALTIIMAIIFRRLRNLKRANKPASSFFNFNDGPTSSRGPYAFPRTTGLPAVNLRGQTYSYPDPLLTGIPTIYAGYTPRRTRATDIDASGRRLGDRNAELDHGDLGDKDVLPAYEHYGGPPKYNELGLQTRLFPVGSGVLPPNDSPANPVACDVDNPTARADVGVGLDNLGERALLSPPRPPELAPAPTYPPIGTTTSM